MPAKVWIDGRLVGKNDAAISVYDHALLFGDGVAEGMRAYGGRVFRLAQHLDRLYQSAAFLSLTIPLSREELSNAIAEALRANNRTDGYVRVLVTRGPGTLGLDPRKCEPTVIVLAEEVMDYPRELYDSGLDVVTAQAIGSIGGVTLLARPASVLGKIAALRAGCLDAVLHDAAGEVLGSTDGSVFAVTGDRVRTHPGNEVARGVVLVEAAASGLQVCEGRLTVDDVLTADEVFLASTAAEVIAVARVNGRPVGAGPIARRIRELYHTAKRAYTEQ